MYEFVELKIEFISGAKVDLDKGTFSTYFDNSFNVYKNSVGNHTIITYNKEYNLTQRNQAFWKAFYYKEEFNIIKDSIMKGLDQISIRLAYQNSINSSLWDGGSLSFKLGSK